MQLLVSFDSLKATNLLIQTSRFINAFSFSPYRSPLLIASQVLSIIAFLISWVWWVTFIIGLPTMLVLQVSHYCNRSRMTLDSLMEKLTLLLFIEKSSDYLVLQNE
jgi:hypothetical protein